MNIYIYTSKVWFWCCCWVKEIVCGVIGRNMEAPSLHFLAIWSHNYLTFSQPRNYEAELNIIYDLWNSTILLMTKSKALFKGRTDSYCLIWEILDFKSHSIKWWVDIVYISNGKQLYGILVDLAGKSATIITEADV